MINNNNVFNRHCVTSDCVSDLGSEFSVTLQFGCNLAVKFLYSLAYCELMNDSAILSPVSQ
jgi:hypothetical protein